MRSRSAHVVTGVAIVLTSAVACASGGDTSTTTSSTSPSASSTTSANPSTTHSTSPSTTSSNLKAIPVYYVAQSQRSFRLYREFRVVPDAGGPIASAVSAMTRLAPLDPDYMTPWRPASRTAVSQAGNNVTVDLSADAFSNTNVGSELAALAIQQLVYTATAAATQSGSPATTVTITRDGKPADVWGVLRIGAATPRAPMLDVQGQAWLTAPQDGDTVKAGRVAFTGFGTSFEATFGWVVRTAAGTTVARGSAMGGTGTGGFGPLSFSAQLAPGTYTVVLSTDDPSGGAGERGPAVDDKSFTVR